MDRIIIHLEGGLIQEVVKEGAAVGIEVIVHDYDIEGVSDDELTTDALGVSCYETTH